MAAKADTPPAVGAAAAAPGGGSPPSPSDEELARRFAAGETNAFELLLDRHRDALYRFARWSLGALREEAEDATQEILVEIHRSLPRFEGRSRLRTWMFGVARNVCRQRRRSFSRASSYTTESIHSTEAWRDLHDLTADLEAALQRRETRKAVRLAIDGLGPEQRSAVLLRDIEGLSYAEIAEVLAIPLGTVRSRLHNARAALADRLARLVIERGDADAVR